MQRRGFLIRLTQACAVLGTLPATLRARPHDSNDTSLHLRDRRIAGSDCYDCHTVLHRPHVGDPLPLRHQPDNPHGERATEVFWHDHKLGYLHRLDNATAASLLDCIQASCAEIIGTDDPEEEWGPVRLRMWADITEASSMEIAQS